MTREWAQGGAQCLMISQPAYSVGHREFTFTFFLNFANIRKGIGAWGNHWLLFRQISVDDFTASVTAAGSGGEHPSRQSPVVIVHLLIKSILNSEEQHCEGQQTALWVQAKCSSFIRSWMQKQVTISKSSRWSWTMFWMSWVQCLVTGEYNEVPVLEAFFSFV